MPTRLIRDGILTSERGARLSWEEEVFYRRLLSVVDDYGLYTSHVAWLRAALYPLQLDKIAERSVQRCLAACETAELIELYAVKDKGYLRVINFGQTCRAQPKCPLPDGYVVVQNSKTSYSLIATDNSCALMRIRIRIY